MKQKPIRTLGKHGLFLQKRFPNRKHSISYAIAAIDELVKVPLNQDQFDALVSLISLAFSKSAGSIKPTCSPS